MLKSPRQLQPHPQRWLLALLCAAAPALSQAQFDPKRVTRETAAVAARFPAPDVSYPTPSLQAGREDFASHAEVLAFLDAAASRSAGRVQVVNMGTSQRGLPVPAAVLTASGRFNPTLPTVLVLAQQHGNEPASGEAALALIHLLSGPKATLLERLNVVVMPRANADGAEAFARTTSNGIDVNRDHLLLRTPEARAIAATAARWKPQVVLDLHEFTVAGRWVQKLAVVQKYDALVQAASVGNLDPSLDQLAKTEFLPRMDKAWSKAGFSSFAYHTTSADPNDKVVAMGGVQPDTGRNTGGLRPAISLLVEVRGIGLGKTHLLRRVHTSVTGSLAVLETAAGLGERLMSAVRQAEGDTAGLACRGELVVAAKHSSARQAMVFLDAVTGVDKPIEVEWRAASPLQVERKRARPCGYLIAPEQTEALERLRLLGVRVQPVQQAARWSLELYDIQAETTGQRQDARGAVDDGDGAAVRLLNVRTRASQDVVGPGHWFVPLDQPMGGLITAAIEPDSQSSYAANRLLDPTRVARVMSGAPSTALR